MNRNLFLALISVSLSLASGHAAQTSTPAATGAVDPGAIEALKHMGAALQSLTRFQVSTELTGERVLADGQKLQHSANATMDVARPNRIRAEMWSPRSERELYYDGKTVSLHTPTQKSYSSVEFSGDLTELVDKLEDRYSIEVPLSDLFLWGTPDAPLAEIESAMNAGQDFIDDDLCDHYAFRQGAIDWQIWISANEKPLPRKLVVTNRADEARPQSVSVIDWDLKPTFKDSTFGFKPPPGTTKAEIVARKAN